MRYFFSNIALLTYLVGLFGWQVNKHYSGGELFDISLFADAEKCCEHNCDCCDDTSNTYQLDTEHDTEQKTKVEIPVLDLPTQYNISDFLTVDATHAETITIRPPPLIPYLHSISNLQSFLC